ncbi:MAG: ORF6N domain-containing protein [Candidatus Hydrogenedentes bacterium]|nr:ORF6N domain-containing protein [Candidatus Hydrogenedentota bacterium]
MSDSSVPAPLARVEHAILAIRDCKVILDSDLAKLYDVETKRLNEQVKRNAERFPADFVFQLTEAEKAEVVAKCDHLKRLKYSPYLPLAFTEHGAIMAASVLNSAKAIEASVYVVRAFIKMREALAAGDEIRRKLAQIERRLAGHDRDLVAVVNAIRQLTKPEALPKKRRIGFVDTDGPA